MGVRVHPSAQLRLKLQSTLENGIPLYFRFANCLELKEPVYLAVGLKDEFKKAVNLLTMYAEFNDKIN